VCRLKTSSCRRARCVRASRVNHSTAKSRSAFIQAALSIIVDFGVQHCLYCYQRTFRIRKWRCQPASSPKTDAVASARGGFTSFPLSTGSSFDGGGGYLTADRGQADPWPRRSNQLMDYRFCVSRCARHPASDLIWCWTGRRTDSDYRPSPVVVDHGVGGGLGTRPVGHWPPDYEPLFAVAAHRPHVVLGPQSHSFTVVFVVQFHKVIFRAKRTANGSRSCWHRGYRSLTFSRDCSTSRMLWTITISYSFRNAVVPSTLLRVDLTCLLFHLSDSNVPNL